MQVWLLHGTSPDQGLTHGCCSSSLCCQILQWHASNAGHCLAWSGASHSRGTKTNRGHTSGMSVQVTMFSEVLLVSETWSISHHNQIMYASRHGWSAAHTHCNWLLFARLTQEREAIVLYTKCICHTVVILFWLLSFVTVTSLSRLQTCCPSLPVVLEKV